VSQPPPLGQRPAPVRPAGSRPHFTGRAAVLAIVLCAIALSLAYPVREYISQRKQIDELQAQSERIWLHRKYLQHESKLLHEPRYIAELARDRLHMCWPTQSCYIIIGQPARHKHGAAPQVASPWYARMWSSVQTANSDPVKRAKAQTHSSAHPRQHPHSQSHRSGRTRSG
jgi:cell division protein FtsB